jgi:hypothetical protein
MTSLPTHLPSPEERQPPNNEFQRNYGWLSLLLIFHLVVVVVCSASNYSPSSLQIQLLRLLRPYSQTLAIDWNFTPFYLTHGEPMDMDCIAEVQPPGSAQWEVWFPVPPWNPESHQRWQRYLRFWAYHVDTGEEQVVAEISRAFAAAYRDSRGSIPQRIRIRRHQPRTWQTVAGLDSSAPADPDAPSYYETLYEAMVIVDEQQSIHIVSVDTQSRPAPPALEVQP